MTGVRVGDVVEWTTRGPVTWLSPDGRQIAVALPDGQRPAGRVSDAPVPVYEVIVDLDTQAVNVLAPDVRAGDVWRSRDGQLWHALQSPGEDGGPVVLLYPSPGGPGEFPEHVHERRGLDLVVFRPPEADDAAQLVEETLRPADDTAVLPRVEEGHGHG